MQINPMKKVIASLPVPDKVNMTTEEWNGLCMFEIQARSMLALEQIADALKKIADAADGDDEVGIAKSVEIMANAKRFQ